MLMSKQQNFSEAQALIATAASTNTIDLGATYTVLGSPVALTRDIGPGQSIPVLVQLLVDSGGTSPTLDVTIEVDDNDAFSSAKVVATAPQVVGGSAGDRVALEWIPTGTDERYMRLNYTLGGTSPTYTVTSGITLGNQKNVVPGA
jgi:hypothetical protein